MRLLPLIFLLLFFGCESKSKDLPILSYKIDDSGNKIYYTIAYQNFTNQLGEPFTTANIKDKILIANFFFTSCPSICPPMRTELVEIAEAFKSEVDFMILSHTIDPENDTVEVLRNYSDAIGIPNEKWQFVRASDENTKGQAAQYMTNFKPSEDGTDFYHSSYVALVDKRNYLRGFYNILVAEEVERLKKDINILLHN